MMVQAGGLLAAQDQPGQAGPLGLFIILALAVATVLLVRSMGRHLKRIPPTFDRTGSDDPPVTPKPPPDAEPKSDG